MVWFGVFKFHAWIIDKKAIKIPCGKNFYFTETLVLILNGRNYPQLTYLWKLFTSRQFDDNVASSADVNNVTQRLKTLSTNSEEPNMEHCSNSKSRLQMRAPPPLSNLPSTNISDASYTGSSILSPCSSNQGGSGVEFGSNNSSWLANSNGLDSLLHHKHLTMCNNDPSKFDDDLPSLLAKQVN